MRANLRVYLPLNRTESRSLFWITKWSEAEVYIVFYDNEW